MIAWLLTAQTDTFENKIISSMSWLYWWVVCKFVCFFFSFSTMNRNSVLSCASHCIISEFNPVPEAKHQKFGMPLHFVFENIYSLENGDRERERGRGARGYDWNQSSSSELVRGLVITKSMLNDFLRQPWTPIKVSSESHMLWCVFNSLVHVFNFMIKLHLKYYRAMILHD